MFGSEMDNPWEEGVLKVKKFEVTIYNQDVRQKVQDGEHHKEFTDSWADFRYVDVCAENEEQVRSKMEERYPSSQGFVIDGILKQDGPRFV